MVMTAEPSSRTETIWSEKPHVVYYVALSRKSPPKAPSLGSSGPGHPGPASPDGTLHVGAPSSHSPLCWGGWTPGSSQDVESPVSKTSLEPWNSCGISSIYIANTTRTHFSCYFSWKQPWSGDHNGGGKWACAAGLRWPAGPRWLAQVCGARARLSSGTVGLRNENRRRRATVPCGKWGRLSARRAWRHELESTRPPCLITQCGSLI